jgi:hypothetical protein
MFKFPAFSMKRGDIFSVLLNKGAGVASAATALGGGSGGFSGGGSRFGNRRRVGGGA